MYNRYEIDGFSDAVESLKKYRRADLIDDDGLNLLETLYTDLLPNDAILQKCLYENTTFLIGRKGTGKSTIFLRVEQEIRKKKDCISCYLDVKTIYESSSSSIPENDYLSDLLPSESLEKYLIERSFIKSVLTEIRKEISIKTDSFCLRCLSHIKKTKPEKVNEKLDRLKDKIENDEMIRSIEIPTLKRIYTTTKNGSEGFSDRDLTLGSLELEVNPNVYGCSGSLKTDSGIHSKKSHKSISETENQFSNVFIQVFQIKEVISEIKDILEILNIKHLYILLDDFSEIDDYAIRTFVDVILAPLNNWSEEFIKFKVAAYPNRIYYGKIDPGKVDTVNLDFYDLYSYFGRDQMEEKAVDFTKRLIEKRILHFTKKEVSYFFDTGKESINEYYKLLFKVSMNVPRIMGYILSYCYQDKIIYNKMITKSDIENASQKYYEEKLIPFFDTTTYSMIKFDEKIPILQFKELLDMITERLVEIRRRINTNDLKGSTYIQNFPYSSHFYLDPRLEEFLRTLELNFFISKYTDLSDKDGTPSSIYCINYGLAKKRNLLWGKPEGNKYRKYFIERPFDFNKLIKDFLSSSKKIYCTNSRCNKRFTFEELPMLEYYHFKCNECGGFVQVEPVLSAKIKSKLEKIDDSKLLPPQEIKILTELEIAKSPLFAKDIAEEVDLSSYVIASRCKKLSEDSGLVKRIKESKLYEYEITEDARRLYFS
jgi:hypothetical protein